MIAGATQLEIDRDLARRIAGGDRQAFDGFFREYFPRLFRFTLARIGNDASLAEEVVQRTMCKVVRTMGSYRGEALLFTWLCQICRNELINIYRQQGAELRADVPLDDHPAVQAALESMMGSDLRPDTSRQREEIAGFVRATLEHLPENYATALELKYMNGCSVAEIAGRLGLGEKAAESVLSRARAAFREGFRSVWDIEADLVRD
jgi:RNA polymerase sigma-70 factor (ECF subfamily)